MSLVVIIKPRAAREVDDAAQWWHEHRPAAVGAVRLDWEAALGLLVEQPEIGTRVENSRHHETRRVLLARTQHYRYYRLRGPHLEVVAFWHASRERGPTV